MHGFGGMGFSMGWGWIIGLVLVAAIIWAIIHSTGQNRNLNNTTDQVAAGILFPFFGILLNPIIAAVAMSFSSVSVITNTLRLRKV